MGALSNSGVEAPRPAPVVVQAAKNPPHELAPPHEPTANDARDGGRRQPFLLALLRALATWCT